MQVSITSTSGVAEEGPVLIKSESKGSKSPRSKMLKVVMKHLGSPGLATSIIEGEVEDFKKEWKAIEGKIADQIQDT